jgi:hypothetical protein
MKALSLSLRPSLFLDSSSFYFLFSFIFAKKSLTYLFTVPSISSYDFFGSGFFFAGRFRFSLVIAPT